MIYTDEYGCFTSEGMDGMDSAMRTGVMATFAGRGSSILSFVRQGDVRRHPWIIPANNFNNCTRDQMLTLTSGLNARGLNKEASEVFWNTIKRGCFAQNVERDKRGSIKMKTPHEFYKDSNPDATTVRLTPLNGFKSNLDKSYEIERKYFDCSDPLLPHHMFHLALCGKVRSMYWLALLAYPLMFLSLLFGSRKIDTEQNQVQSMIKTYGRPWVFLYKLFNPRWKDQTRYYWDSRNESEYADAIIRSLS